MGILFHLIATIAQPILGWWICSFNNLLLQERNPVWVGEISPFHVFIATKAQPILPAWLTDYTKFIC